MSIRSQLLDHVGHPVAIIEGRAGRIGIKCCGTSCSGYGRITDLTALVAGQPAGAQLPLGTAGPPQPPTKAEECPAHVGQHRTACGPCNGEAKAADPDLQPRPIRSGADPSTVPEVAATKARLAELAAARGRKQRAADVMTDPPAHPATTTPSAEGAQP